MTGPQEAGSEASRKGPSAPLARALWDDATAVLEKHGDASARLEFHDEVTSHASYDIRQVLTLTPGCTHATKLKRADLRKAKQHKSADAAISTARKRAEQEALSLLSGSEPPARPELTREDGEAIVWTAPHADCFAQQCGSCGGNGKSKCAYCSGRGRRRCTSCGGRGENVCGMCGGLRTTQHTQFISGQYVSQYVTCATCIGTGATQCFSCAGMRETTCASCGGRGSVACKSCNGKGETITALLGQIVASCKTEVIATNGATDVTDRIAQSRSSLIENASSIAQSRDDQNGLQRTAVWDAEVPIVTVRYTAAGQSIESCGAGSKLAAITHPPFLDALYKSNVQEAARIVDVEDPDGPGLEVAFKRLLEFGLGRRALERAAKGRCAPEGIAQETRGAASSAFCGEIAAAANELIGTISERAAGWRVRWAAVCIGGVLGAISLFRGWPHIANGLSTVGLPQLSPLLSAVLISIIAVSALLVFGIVAANARLRATAGIWLLRPSFKPRTWIILALAILAAPLMELGMSALLSSP